jgi:hypothetical protein
MTPLLPAAALAAFKASDRTVASESISPLVGIRIVLLLDEYGLYFALYFERYIIDHFLFQRLDVNFQHIDFGVHFQNLGQYLIRATALDHHSRASVSANPAIAPSRLMPEGNLAIAHSHGVRSQFETSIKLAEVRLEAIDILRERFEEIAIRIDMPCKKERRADANVRSKIYDNLGSAAFVVFSAKNFIDGEHVVRRKQGERHPADRSA